ncbi:HNH endonuclease, partial [Pseudonocardia sp.]|uniref:HNH endonuclease n=1 Tax=Pseudonocardia sp. TaxID=60912 RepID=UPI0031FBE5BC
MNASFEPLAVVTAKRAIVLMLAGKAECVQTALEGAAFHSESLTLPWPSVMRLSRYVRVPYRRAVPMTRAGVLRRDLRRCAYCTRKADTIDHVVPRSRGGGHTWENCVA